MLSAPSHPTADADAPVVSINPADDGSALALFERDPARHPHPATALLGVLLAGHAVRLPGVHPGALRLAADLSIGTEIVRDSGLIAPVPVTLQGFLEAASRASFNDVHTAVAGRAVGCAGAAVARRLPRRGGVDA